jgi:hypothetical protein
MKLVKTISINVALLLLFTVNLRANEGCVTIHVDDEGGLPIAKAKANVQFTVGIPGGGLGNGKVVNVEGLTDTNGICVLTGNGDDAAVSAAVLKDGYYGAGGYRMEFTNSLLGRWQPWNPTIEVVLQKKGVQVPMYARRVDEIKIPVEGKPVGFDLEIGDWVAPYGKGGTADLLFQLERMPEPEVPVREIQPFDVTLTVSFSNDGDGIQSVFVPPQVHSGLRLPRQAPTEGYESVLVKHQYKERGQRAHIEFREDQNYFFRVRTKRDAQGNIVSALYGKIYGDFNQDDGGFVGRGKLAFTYYLNPEPNSLNMEFDPSRNLSKNLKSLEGVSVP